MVSVLRGQGQAFLTLKRRVYLVEGPKKCKQKPSARKNVITVYLFSIPEKQTKFHVAASHNNQLLIPTTFFAILLDH